MTIRCLLRLSISLVTLACGRSSSSSQAQDVPVHRVPLNLDAEATATDSVGWTVSRNPLYERMVVTDTVFHGRQALELKSLGGAGDQDFGTFNQRVDARQYRGKWVRFSAMIRARTSSPGSRAALYLRVNGPSTVLALDNMDGRETTDSAWRRLAATVFVASNAEFIAFGPMLEGLGRCGWTKLPSLRSKRRHRPVSPMLHPPTSIPSSPCSVPTASFVTNWTGKHLGSMHARRRPTPSPRRTLTPQSGR